MKKMTMLIPERARKRCADLLYVNITTIRWMLRTLTLKKRHKLPAKLVISLTSYPPRYPTLTRTLKTLLSQSMKPDRVLLWIAYSDYADLPADVLRLTTQGLEIRKCDDLRSYKKIVPALEFHSKDFIVTADDDVYYPHKWLEGLVNCWRGEKEVIFHRGHEIAVDNSGKILPYRDWSHEVQSGSVSDLYFPTGMGGVMYPPGALNEQATEASSFLSLCPTADDVWLYFMARLNGYKWRHVGTVRRFRAWVGSEESGLMVSNLLGQQNDKQINLLVERFGFSREEDY